MNLGDIHKLSNKEIVQSIARMNDAPMEKAMRAELDVRFMQAVTDLSSNVYSLRLSLDSIAKSNRANKTLLVFISLFLIIIIGILAYYIFRAKLL
ncbi:MAG: hypothetical protein KJ915_00290 [Candidatus Omnitrophica bacterium]|nr:hypothetical protein [Candidatus Omnitrophota bacterium]